MTKISVIIAEESYLIRSGLARVIEGFNCCQQAKEISTQKDFKKNLETSKSDILIVNEKIVQKNSDFFTSIQNKKKNPKIIIIHNTECDSEIHELYENIIFLNDDKNTISKKIWEVIKNLKPDQSEKVEELSEREKEIVSQIALGKTNKEIAEKLYISSHTVISHRKNIVRKLSIKTVSGLTVYAILNKLISINDAKY